MREDEREEALRELDEDMKYFRLAAGRKKTRGWKDASLLRRIRQSLGIPLAEVLGALDMNRSVLGRLEVREERRTISLKALDRVAKALGCRVVYGIVPVSGEKLGEIGERRRWERRMRNRFQ